MIKLIALSGRMLRHLNEDTHGIVIAGLVVNELTQRTRIPRNDINLGIALARRLKDHLVTIAKTAKPPNAHETLMLAGVLHGVPDIAQHPFDIFRRYAHCIVADDNSPLFTINGYANLGIALVHQPTLNGRIYRIGCVLHILTIKDKLILVQARGQPEENALPEYEIL
ncbi:MAG: hypothetical protein MJZ42_05215 [Bacteroidales bacterium]|nr:hypothetical protein [Bacteroidales bacterium]